MIRKTFCFIDGIGKTKERWLWKQGIESWNDFLETESLRGMSAAAKAYADRQIRAAKEALYQEDAAYFAKRLPSSEHWRLYEFFHEDALFLDIETSGVYEDSKITVVGLSDGLNYSPMVEGINLDYARLQSEISRHKLIVTFNGASFDMPFLRKYGITSDLPHLDLKHACAAIDLRGGLKEIERTLGFTRTPIVQGLHGGDALTLWKMYRATGDQHYLDILVEYNEEDTVNLRHLADHTVKELTRRCMPIELPPIA